MTRCLYCHFWADIDSSPTQSGLIRALADEGIEIDLVYETRDFLLPPCLPENVRPFRVDNWRDCAEEVMAYVVKEHFDRQYSFILAVDAQGLAVALPIEKQMGIPLVFLSCELTFRDELENSIDHALKDIEIEGTQRSSLIIIQDKERGRLLAEENGLDMGKFVFLPNAPGDKSPTGGENYLRLKFGIPPQKKIVLHAGSFDAWTYGQELVEAAHTWDNGFILVIHTRQIPHQGDFMSKLIDQCDPEKVLFSSQPLPFDEYGKIIESCDIGLVLYKIFPTKYTQKNLFHIGLSSGKLSYFARHAKPLVASDLPGFRRLFSIYNNGICVSSIEAIHDALLTDSSQMMTMGKNNRLFFEEQLDFGKNIAAVLRKIKALVSSLP